MSKPQGVLNIHKPAGITSRLVVDAAVRALGTSRIGHAGTLDPLATGVLVLCVGPATRLISYVQQSSKIYRAGFLLGQQSDTDDITGLVKEVAVERIPTADELAAALPEFVGTVSQVPPTYSAVHVEGRRAYQLARKGATVTLAARPVEVLRIELLAFEYPHLSLEIECGSGTYIRSIGRDLGERLGTGAVMSSLVRTRVGPFDIESALPLEQLTPESARAALQPLAAAVAQLPRHILTDEERLEVIQGKVILHHGEIAGARHNEVALVTADGQLVAMAERKKRGKLQPRLVFNAQD